MATRDDYMLLSQFRVQFSKSLSPASLREAWLLRHRGNTYLTSLPLVSVHHHGRANSVKVEINFTSSASSIFLVHNWYCDKCIKQPYLQVLKLRASFLAKFWRLTSVKTSYQNCLAFVILCSNRWLKIEMTARQKSVCRLLPFLKYS